MKQGVLIISLFKSSNYKLCDKIYRLYSKKKKEKKILNVPSQDLLLRDWFNLVEK